MCSEVAPQIADKRSFGVWWRSEGPMMPLGRNAIVENSRQFAAHIAHTITARMTESNT